MNEIAKDTLCQAGLPENIDDIVGKTAVFSISPHPMHTGKPYMYHANERDVRQGEVRGRINSVHASESQTKSIRLFLDGWVECSGEQRPYLQYDGPDEGGWRWHEGRRIMPSTAPYWSNEPSIQLTPHPGSLAIEGVGEIKKEERLAPPKEQERRVTPVREKTYEEVEFERYVDDCLD